MSLIAFRIVALAFAILIARVGWAMAHNPDKALRWFTFGQEPMFGKAFGLRFCQIVGWFFVVGMSLGAILLAISLFS